MNEQLSSFFCCSFWVHLFAVLFLCWQWVTAGALSLQLLSVACAPPHEKPLIPAWRRAEEARVGPRPPPHPPTIFVTECLFLLLYDVTDLIQVSAFSSAQTGKPAEIWARVPVYPLSPAERAPVADYTTAALSALFAATFVSRLTLHQPKSHRIRLEQDYRQSRGSVHVKDYQCAAKAQNDKRK